MGSSGFGQFGTYRVTVGGGPLNGNNGNGGAGDGNGGNGFESPEKLDYIRLEDVAISDYYRNRNNVPSRGEPVSLLSKIYNSRLVVASDVTGEVIGNLPTRYNYLYNTIIRGIQYKGAVVSSGLSPIPYVVVSLHA